MTVSGPPSTLKSLSRASLFASSSPQPCFNGPYHASHLYSSSGAEELLQLKRQNVSLLLGRYIVRVPWLSTSSTHWIEPETPTVDLLKEAVNDILCRTSQSADVLKACKSLVSGSGPACCEVLLVGPTSHEPEFVSAFTEDEQVKVKVYEQPPKELSLIRLNQAPRTARKSKLAIVGMAGRFPDSASHEELWQLLEAGLDVHREVCTWRIRSNLSGLMMVKGTRRPLRRQEALRSERQSWKY